MSRARWFRLALVVAVLATSVFYAVTVPPRQTQRDPFDSGAVL